MLGDTDIRDATITLHHKRHFDDATHPTTLRTAREYDMLVKISGQSDETTRELRHLFHHLRGSELRTFDRQVRLSRIMVHILIRQFIVRHHLTVVRSIDTDGRRRHSFVHNGRRTGLATRRSDDTRHRTTSRHSFALKSIARLQGAELLHLCLDFRCHLFDFSVSHIAEGGTKSERNHQDREKHIHDTTIATPSLLADDISAIGFVAALKDHLAPLSGK